MHRRSSSVMGRTQQTRTHSSGDYLPTHDSSKRNRSSTKSEQGTNYLALRKKHVVSLKPFKLETKPSGYDADLSQSMSGTLKNFGSSLKKENKDLPNLALSARTKSNKKPVFSKSPMIRSRGRAPK